MKEESLKSKELIQAIGYEDNGFHTRHVKKALQLQDGAFIKLVGLINGLTLVNRFNPIEVNTLLGEYQDKISEIFGDFEK